jgi:hypothetical protein
MTEAEHGHSAQDTGNPVLDSLINLSAASGGMNTASMKQLHAALLELAAAEPGGLKRRGKDGALALCESSQS